MRVTNAMMANNMLININRNTKYINGLWNQMGSTKRIQVPSDDPIIASRALKFRSNVTQTLQYQRNVAQGMSWMSVTEAAFKNVEEIMKSLREKCTAAAHDTYVYSDKSAIAAEIRQMVEQIKLEMNVTYAGRYVFSGYRTDRPPIYIEDNNFRYDIRQYYGAGDIEKTKSYQKIPSAGSPPGTATPLVYDVNILKLPYTYIDDNSISISVRDNSASPPALNPLTVTIGAVTYDVVVQTCSVNDDPSSSTGNPNPYDNSQWEPDPLAVPPVIVVRYIEETGELVMNDEVMEKIAASGSNVEITYTKTNFKVGELNPMVYFECRDRTPGSVSFGMEFNMDNQDIRYEFSVSTQVNINSLALNVFTDKMYADMKALCDLVADAQLSDEAMLRQKYIDLGFSGLELEERIAAQMTEEKGRLQSVLHLRFNNMLAILERHGNTVSREFTDLGARMQRLDMFESRLEQDEGTYRKLMSDNEDADLVQVMMDISIAEAAYQAALKAGASIMQLTLADFI